MQTIPLAIIGCGGMGHRHLYGLAELHRAGFNRFELIAACDPVRDNAESLADQAAEFFGRRPTVVSKIEDLASLGVQAVDITTTPRPPPSACPGRAALRDAHDDRKASRFDGARLQHDPQSRA
jgi:ornithine cyclodeaminase/alanine dehydrogenase-like protein (mu-crystallin family)